MSIFSSIVAKIFPPGHPALNRTVSRRVQDKTSRVIRSAPPSLPATSSPTVDIEEILDDLSQQQGGRFDWRSSIVDFMKLLGLDSGMAARKTLAMELHYTGDMNELARMNRWLHKQLLRQLAASGGKVPENLTG